ncbi:MAG: hypothetical protein IIB05_10755 [Bacteroidetes bacterium]|nr:hypothetical protein [Bacteroidota bacterium]
MKTAVQDANIIFDLFNIDLLDVFFELEIEIFITDFIAGEINKSEQKEFINKYISTGETIVLITTPEEIIELISIRNQTRGLSIADCSILFHATKNKAFILTGDNTLRKYAESNQIEVHGILWVLDELIKEKQISEKKAYLKLTQLMETNSRLPRKECEKRLKNWS